MARIKLPESLKSWKVIAQLPDEKENKVFKISKKRADGTTASARLTLFELADDDYNQDNVDYIEDEVKFIKSIIDLGDFSNYIDIQAMDKPEKKVLDLYIVTEDIPPLSSIMGTKEFSDNDVVDFGLQMSEILEKLAGKNIFHGNIKPSNIFVASDGKYKLGGFIDAESAVDDLTYIAPEIHREGQADFTTDIYSLGLIMYSMCNSNKLPFESDETSKDEAINKRLDGDTLHAPSNGNEKLKSVIIIACQSENKNRWKNAGNIKNALSSIKAELASESGKPAQVIVPESTDFDGNVFEEYSFDEAEDISDENIDVNEEVVAEEPAVANETEEIQESPSEAEENAAEEPLESESNNPDIQAETDSFEEIDPSYKEPEIDNRVFDDYQNQTKVFNISNPDKNGDKDYGDYFDDYDDSESKTDTKAETSEPQKSNYDANAFYTESNEDEPRSKKGFIAAIIAGIVILLILLGILGVVAFNNGLFGAKPDTDKTNPTETSAQIEPTSASETTVAPTTMQETTVAPTTAEPTTEAEYKTVISVLGCSYDYAKQLLEAEGFAIEEGAYRYSDYDEGCVIAQTPGEGQTAEVGSTIIVDISIGPEPTEAQQSIQTSQGITSSYKNNTSYLSQEEVSKMSREQLNLALNEIYARRGRIFTDPNLDAHFRAQSWYTPLYTADEFAQNVVFNDYEVKNINLIINEQSSRGYR